MNRDTFDNYLSPFSWRYGSDEMRAIWSEAHKRRLWRRIWVALAEAQREAGLVSSEQVADLRAHADQVNVARALEIEAQIQHDVMAEVKAFAEQCPIGGGIIHLGATSADVEDNADALRLRESLDLVLERLVGLLEALAEQIERWADTPCMGFTHIQPAEPTTVGYRLAQYAQDLLLDLEELRHVRAGIRGKGLKGATGTSASYAELLQRVPPSNSPQGGENSTSPPLGQFVPRSEAETGGTEGGTTPADLEAHVMATLDLQPFPVSTQTYPRKQDWLVLNGLAGLAGSLYKLAFDLRLLQSPLFGEWSEPFGIRQVGSTAMPFKRNPVHAENMDSLARFVAALPRVAWDNAAHSLLERTLDDKANRRIILPQAFLATDEQLRRALRIIEGLVVYEEAVARNLVTYGTFAATERLLMVAVRAGADRQAMHELIREHSMAAWAAIQSGAPNPLTERLATDERVVEFVPPQKVRALLDASAYVGDAPQRARELVRLIRTTIR
jgi:adenylosuccinate lyase